MKFIKFFIFTIIIFFQCSEQLSSQPYIVVLDPGHGGRNLSPISIYGDKYNPLYRYHTDRYRSGAYLKGVKESEEVYAISKKIKNILNLTLTTKGRNKFKKILKKYTKKIPKEIKPVKSYLSRKKGYVDHYQISQYDINSPYRLYDHLDLKTEKKILGTISRINQLKPQLTVTIHLTSGYGAKYGALNSVITPGYKTYKQALAYNKVNFKKQRAIKKKFYKSPYKAWFGNIRKRSLFEWFLCDSWVYFNGYWSKKSGKSVDLSKVRGYRHNMVSWAYNDADGWVARAKKHPQDSPYALQLKYFSPKGKFWKREKSIFENYRRENGYEGYGGDNFYASQELLRYIRKGLHVNGISKKKLPKLKHPYISTWSVPTYINSISAYLEIGYLGNKIESKRILNKKRYYAEALAVGIYSLLNSLPQNKRTKDFPKGRKLNLKKYKNYFNEVN